MSTPWIPDMTSFKGCELTTKDYINATTKYFRGYEPNEYFKIPKNKITIILPK